ncbi:DoxX family protein [Bacteroidia bacterium]|nr:DoxX family protein [Bacteroidia bacterium]MDB9881868.1 DoxX family protein [Bacteroidia bacterium]
MNDNNQNNKATNIGLWIAQGLMAGMFIMAGASKAFQPIATLAESMPWVNDVSNILIRFIGVSELLGGLGIILPAILRIKPKLTIYAALGLVAIMIMAAGFHTIRGEYPAIGGNIFFATICGFVAWGRGKRVLT